MNKALSNPEHEQLLARISQLLSGAIASGIKNSLESCRVPDRRYLRLNEEQADA